MDEACYRSGRADRGLLALSAGAASAQDVAADVSANLGRPTSAQARVCADGRVLSGLLGRCSGSGTGASAQAGSSGIRVRARVPGTAQADVSVGARRSRPSGTASGQASATPRSRSASADASASADTSPRADAEASLTRRTARLLDLDATVSLAGVGVIGSSPFTLAGDPATANLLPIGELTLDGLTGEAPAGIGVLDTGPIASGNQVDVDAGYVSPSVPVTVCGNSVGVLGDTSASCTPAQPSGSSGSSGSGSRGASAGTGSASSDSLLANFASGNQVDAGVGSISPSVPVTVCGNSVGVLGDASASCGTTQMGGSNDGSGGGLTVGTSGANRADGPLAGNQVDANLDDVSATVPVTASCNSVGLLGDASSNCGTTTNPNPRNDTSADIDLSLGTSDTDPSTTAIVDLTTGTSGISSGTDPGSDDVLTIGTSDPDTSADVDLGIGTFGIDTGTETSTGGIIAPPPGTTSSGGTGADGTPGSSTGTSGIPGAVGLAPGSGDADSSVTSFAPLRPSVAGSGALPSTGAASDLLALAAFGLLVVGALVVRATRPAATREGGDDR